VVWVSALRFLQCFDMVGDGDGIRHLLKTPVLLILERFLRSKWRTETKVELAKPGKWPLKSVDGIIRYP